MKLTLVLANQRSGSTLLCQDIASLGGMGRPGEYFLRFTGGPHPKPNVGPADLKARMEGQDATRAEPVAAVKLMLNYAGRIEQYLSARTDRRLAPGAAAQAFVDWARASYDSVNLLVITRENPVDQAISRVLAAERGLYHSRKPDTAQPPLAFEDDAAEQAFAARVLQAVAVAAGERDALIDLAQANGALHVTYEALVADPKGMAGTIVEHAKAADMQARRNVPTRRLRKVVTSEDAQTARAALKRYLQDRVLPFL